MRAETLGKGAVGKHHVECLGWLETIIRKIEGCFQW